MSLKDFELHQPRTVAEALETASRFYGDSAFMAGGTDLLPGLKQNLDPKRHLISLSRIGSLARITTSSIGSGATIASLARAGDPVPAVLRETAKTIAGPAIREAATVGGNLLLSGRCVYLNRSESYRCSLGACMKAEGDECIAVAHSEKCYAPFSGDLAPVFLVLGAGFRVAGMKGERVIPAASFFLPDGMYATVLKPGELLTEVLLPGDASELEARYLKLRPRSAMDFPDAGVAVAVKRDDKGVSELRAAFGALAPMPLLCVKTREDLQGMGVDMIARSIWKELVPDVFAVRNSFFPPSYRKEMSQHYLRLVLAELLPDQKEDKK